MSTIAIKRGVTLGWTAVLTVDDAPVNLTGATVDCSVKRISGGTSGDLTAAITDGPNGIVTLGATSAETALWLVGLYQCDVRYTLASTDVIISETFEFIVREPISNGS